MPDRPNPYDVEALERAVGDSATRVSTIWVSFLFFSLYLLIAATTVTQRELLLAQTIKLPVLDINLPLWGFFVLAPSLFVLLHVYVLLQVILLGRTAAAYDTAIERFKYSDEEDTSLRMRLTNTLFAQVFAGAHRERKGVVGALLKGMAWMTLAIAPILIVSVFQFRFLAYHSHVATWLHRSLIGIELAIIVMIWPLAWQAERELDWPNINTIMKYLGAGSAPQAVSRKKDTPSDTFSRRLIAFSVPALFAIFSLGFATFPGEPLVNALTLQAPSFVECDRIFYRRFGNLDLRFDRIVAAGVDVVDDEKIKKLESANLQRERQWHGGTSRDFSYRNLNCADLSSADLRRVDLSVTRMTGAILAGANLQDAWLDSAELQGASFLNADLRRAYLGDANLQGARLDAAQLQETKLDGAAMQGATLQNAKLQGASLRGTHLQGASFKFADLQGASLNDAQLVAANLESVQLQGASLDRAELQAASINGAQMNAATLIRAQLQGALIVHTVLDYALLSNVWIWRAKLESSCNNIQSLVRSDPVIEVTREQLDEDQPILATPNSILDFIHRSVAEIPEIKRRNEIAMLMSSRLIPGLANDDTIELAKRWSDCERESSKNPEAFIAEARATFLRDLACDPSDKNEAIAKGVVDNILGSKYEEGLAIAPALVRGLLSQDGRTCSGTKNLAEATKTLLRTATK